jgi:hypothetical protein
MNIFVGASTPLKKRRLTLESTVCSSLEHDVVHMSKTSSPLASSSQVQNGLLRICRLLMFVEVIAFHQEVLLYIDVVLDCV